DGHPAAGVAEGSLGQAQKDSGPGSILLKSVLVRQSDGGRSGSLSSSEFSEKNLQYGGQPLHVSQLAGTVELGRTRDCLAASITRGVGSTHYPRRVTCKAEPGAQRGRKLLAGILEHRCASYKLLFRTG